MDALKSTYLQQSSKWILFTIANFIAFFNSFGNNSWLETIKNLIFPCFQMLEHLSNPFGVQLVHFCSFSVTSRSGFFSSFRWFATCSANHLLYFSLIKHLAGVLTVMSRGWNIFIKLFGTITTAPLLSAHKLAIAYLAPKCVHYFKCHMIILSINAVTHFRWGKTISLNKLSVFSVFDQWFSE